tara:strand:- start:39 stop:281 length:243 start_codon:yes stop_codon:yes gene_type:complete
MNLKIGQEVDGRTIDRITMDRDTRDMTVWFDKDYPVILEDTGELIKLLTNLICSGRVIVVRHNESIDKVLNHKWETQDAG